MRDLEVGDRIGRYRIQSVLGQGGMGRVYRARDEHLERDVAIKVVATETSSADAGGSYGARLLREGRAAAAVTHKNLVAVFDVGEHEGHPYIVMELVHGSTLRAYIGEESVPIDRRLAWLREAAEGLHKAHQVGLVHRDVKPDNVMVTDDGPVKVLDFGIARRDASGVDPSAPTAAGGLGTLTAPGGAIGTPAYMAPECIRDGVATAKADQFAWGVMAYELLAGKHPFGAGGAFAVAAAILRDPPPPIARAGVAAHVENAIARTMAKDPADRFATMREVLDAIEGGEPSTVAPAPAPAEPVAAATAPRPADRPRRPVVAIVVVAAGAIGVAAMAGRSLFATHGSEETGVSPDAPTSVTAPSASTAPAPMPSGSTAVTEGEPPALRRLCRDGERANGDRGCKDTQPWCDDAGRFITCCAEGLAATADGVCECPPGGTHAPAAQAQGCRGAPPDWMKGALARIKERQPQIRACYSAARERNPEIEGGMSFGFDVGPYGDAFGIVLEDGSVADVEVQRCARQVFAGIRFEPPPDGYLRATYPFVFRKESP